MEDELIQDRSASQGEQSRQAIISEARSLFAREGYASVSIDRVLQKPNLTKGSFYHHFSDKRALFRSVVEEVQREVASRAASSGATQEAGDALLAICRSFFFELQKADVMRIICRDAGSILTSAECREIDERHIGAVLGQAIERAQGEGLFADRLDANALIRTITGAIYQTLEWAWEDESGHKVADGEFILLKMVQGLMRR